MNPSRDLLLRWVVRPWADRWIPPDLPDGDPVRLLWARLQVGVGLLLFSLATAFGVGDLLVGLYALSVPLLIGAASALWMLRELRRTGDIVWAGNLFCAAGYIVILGNSLLNGGLTAAVLMFLSVLPSLALLFAGGRSGLAWLAVVIGTDLTLLAFHQAGYAGWQTMPAGMLAVNQGLVLVALAVFLASTAQLHQEIRDWLLVRLERAQRYRTRRIVDAVHDALFVTGPDGRVVSANQAAKDLFDLGDDDAPRVTDLLPGLVADDDGLATIELERDDEVRVFETGVSELDDERVFVLRDITERRRNRARLEEALHRAEDASRAKSSFLASMSHELRTPLNAVIGYSEMMIEMVADDEPVQEPDDLERIVGSARHLLALLDQILDLAKVESGKMVLELRDVDLPSLFGEIVGVGHPLAAIHGNVFSATLDLDRAVATTDSVRTRQIVLNLLSNAAKFTHQGTIDLYAGVTDDELVVQVRDTGIGMTPEQQQRVWEEFVQAQKSTTREYGGTGLGLPLSRRLANLLGGELSLESAPGIGSTFCLRIPLVHPGAMS